MKGATCDWDDIKKRWPEKFEPEGRTFLRINPGDRIFVGTGCGEPQHLVRSLLEYVKSRPKAFVDAELLNIVTLGVAPYTDEKFRYNFRLNSFFISDSTRRAVNLAAADYTPVFLSAVPDLILSGRIKVDVALVQTSLPDDQGRMNLGVSVDIVEAAVKEAALVIAQSNAWMPRVEGDGWITIDDVDFVIPHDEPLLEYVEDQPEETSQRIGRHVSRLIEDGSTIQVGYGAVPGAILSCFGRKKHLGVHTELFSDGIADLMRRGVVDNSMKTLDNGKTIATFCMGRKETYEYIDENPAVEFRSIDYTNSPLNIAQNRGMTAINSALEVDLTGQATAESIGKIFYSGIGGQADFMRGAVMAPGGKTILALPSTADDGSVSRIVPQLRLGSGVTLTRGDIHYVVTEYGIAYLHGKSVRERAMDLISIAHPRFRPWLVDEAKKLSLIYPDQAIIPGKRGEYPEDLESRRTTKTGLKLFLRPVKISDEPLLREFFYSLSDESAYQRFLTSRREFSHEVLQDFLVVDHLKKKVILAVLEGDQREPGESRDYRENTENREHRDRRDHRDFKGDHETIVGIGQYGTNMDLLTADVALAVRDDYQEQGVGGELLSYLTYVAKKQGLLGFTAEVLAGNIPVFHLFRKMGFDIEKRNEDGVFEMRAMFR